MSLLVRAGAVFLSAVLSAAVFSRSSADDRPVIVVNPDGPIPARLEVHVGEVVSWRGRGNERLRIELDHHPNAHEIIERQGEVRGVFRRAGEHTYVARVGDAKREGRGVIVVRDSLRPGLSLPDCAPESSERICFEP
jgi:plastocyanin